MVNEATGVAKVIDPEFCIYGPPGLDVGSLLSGIALAAIYHHHSGRSEKAAVLVEVTEKLWAAYSDAMADAKIAQEVIEKTGQDAVGFAMCEVARTALGFAGDRVWLKFDDADKSSAVHLALEPSGMHLEQH